MDETAYREGGREVEGIRYGVRCVFRAGGVYYLYKSYV